MSCKGFILIKGASVHNLKGISFQLPLNSITFIVGPSGSGKSSLAANLLYPEGRYRYQLALAETAGLDLASNRPLLRPKVDVIEPIPPTLLLSQHSFPSGSSTLATLTGVAGLVRRILSMSGERGCAGCGNPILTLSRQQVAPAIMEEFSGAKIVMMARLGDLGHGPLDPLLDRLLEKGFIRIALQGDQGVEFLYLDDEGDRRRIHSHSDSLSRDGLLVVVDRLVVEPQKANRLIDSVSTALGLSDSVAVLPAAEPLAQARFYHTGLGCPRCGAGMEATEPLYLGKSKEALLAANAVELMTVLSQGEVVSKRGPGFRDLSGRLMDLLKWLDSMGLGHIPLSRTAQSLSSGERLKARLLRLLRHGLSGLLYILDEPLYRFEAKEKEKIFGFIERLRSSGNTVVIVEHDLDFIEKADWVIELGPGAGDRGGELIFQGPVDQWLASGTLLVRGLEGEFDSSRKENESPSTYRSWIPSNRRGESGPDAFLKSLPVSGLVVLRGPSGAGKSRMLQAIHEALKGSRYLPRAVKHSVKSDISVDVRRPCYLIGQASRPYSAVSIVASALGIWGEIRRLFSRLPTARARGYSASWFSLARKGGRCEHCRGTGKVVEEVPGLPLFEETCPICQGARFSRELLDIEFKGYSISDILRLDVSTAAKVFGHIPSVRGPLEALSRFGMDYLLLGQPTASLSGGEFRRLRLIQLGIRGAERIQDRERGSAQRDGDGKGDERGGLPVFLLDEPSAGLSAPDMEALIGLIRGMTSRGCLVVAADNSKHLARVADCVVLFQSEELTGPKG